ncbi:MAG: hypothetical protein QF745_06100, partial [Planctomycetota bacterium]|nr:hypothetical protein [Planctomycetota bacterium]
QRITLPFLFYLDSRYASRMKTPPLLQWLAEQYQHQPIVTVVLGLIALAVLLLVMRKTLKVFAVIAVLLVVAILASYLIQGPEGTREGIDKAVDKVKDQAEKVSDTLRD